MKHRKPRLSLHMLLLCMGLAPGRPASAQSLSTVTPGSVRMPPWTVHGKRPIEKKLVLVGMQESFSHESWPEAEQRAADELRSLGFSVVRVNSSAQKIDARLAELGARATAEHAMGAVRIVRQGGQRVAKIWLHDAITGKMLLRTIKIGVAGGADAGMRVVELIYASLLETQLQPLAKTPVAIRQLVRKRLARVRKSPDKSGPKDQAAPKPELTPWCFGFAPALQLHPGEAGPAFGFIVAVQRPLLPSLAIGLSLFAPGTGATVEASPGAADLQLFSAQLGVSYGPWPHARISPSLGLGLGALILRSSGRATSPFISDVDWAAALGAQTTLGVAVRLSGALKLQLSADVVLALPRLGVRLGAERVAVLGYPLLRLGVGLLWSWHS